MKYISTKDQPSVSVSLKNHDCVLNAVVKDQCIFAKRKIPVKVVANSEGTIDIYIKGYDSNGSIITLEVWDGKLRLLVWAGDCDGNDSEEPTHIINLEGVKAKVKAKAKVK